MKISTRGRYALRLMMDIALAEGDAPVRIKDIAERQELSEKYLEQIVSVLNKAG
ncbi:MAG: Rrf2 family transcriptional regulator, partial [Schwartzia sp.]|nr:Rrf2 family transcriptional regulator [Schwartzia sp. (in: firmicutes)]